MNKTTKPSTKNYNLSKKPKLSSSAKKFKALEDTVTYHMVRLGELERQVDNLEHFLQRAFKEMHEEICGVAPGDLVVYKSDSGLKYLGKLKEIRVELPSGSNKYTPQYSFIVIVDGLPMYTDNISKARFWHRLFLK